MKKITGILFLLLIASPLMLLAASSSGVPAVAGIRLEFILFALTLVGVAVFHNQTMYVALTGLALILGVKLGFDQQFHFVAHFLGDANHEGEWSVLLNLIGLLFGFGILAKHFEESKIPDKLPDILPDDWKGGFMLLFLIMVLSSFLDNIAAAMIGGTIAFIVFNKKVHITYLAAIIAASNAGGAGSVVGDTTTTLMWIDGVSPIDVTHAFIGSVVAFLIFGTYASIVQDKYNRIQKDATVGVQIDYKKIMVVALILAGAIATNFLLDFPALGVWLAILIGALFVTTPWHEIKSSWQGTVFLVALVTCASLMPVEDLPVASWQTAFSFGFISAVFDNIPLTKLCLEQGGYDWGILAFTVGFGGSMVWFGSSAGVALSNMFPEARSVGNYLRHGWIVIVAYVIAFFVMLGVVGWHPHAPHKENKSNKHEQPLHTLPAAEADTTQVSV